MKACVQDDVTDDVTHTRTLFTTKNSFDFATLLKTECLVLKPSETTRVQYKANNNGFVTLINSKGD